MMHINEFKTIIFDCDGVILNSNNLKTQAFYDIALEWGSDIADEFVLYHRRHGGLSRYVKFNHFIENILRLPVGVGTGLGNHTLHSSLLSEYEKKIKAGLKECEIASCLDQFREMTTSQKWSVVSGSDQAELNQCFKERKLSHFFDGGVFGSPTDKNEIFQREVSNGNFKRPILFIGDSKYDFDVSVANATEFIFLSDWTDLVSWQDFIANQKVIEFGSISKLYAYLISATTGSGTVKG